MTGSTPPTILCVDDDGKQCLAYRALLAPVTAAVETAESAVEALELLKQCPFDLVILDVMMPDTNGFELARQIREEHTDLQDGVPILFVSALDRHGNAEAACKAGGDDFLTKPVRGAELRARVRALLEVGRVIDGAERQRRYRDRLAQLDGGQDQ